MVRGRRKERDDDDAAEMEGENNEVREIETLSFMYSSATCHWENGAAWPHPLAAIWFLLRRGVKI